MTKQEEISPKGKEIPAIVKLAYYLKMESVMPGLAEIFKEQGIFDLSCEYWFNKMIKETIVTEVKDD